VVTKASPCRQAVAGRSGEMSDQRRESAALIEPCVDRRRQPFATVDAETR